MANPEHLEILNQGVDVWNEWRNKNVEVRPDLRNADLSSRGLIGANFGHADLKFAILSGSDLSNAILSWTDFRASVVTMAILRSSDLWMSDLSEADFDGTDLTNSILKFVNLTGSTLARTDFSKSIMGPTILGDNDLSETKGLEDVLHDFPSTIGIDTIYKSGGKIPEVFLRGCGVPEDFITYMHSLSASGKPIQFYSCFISYSSKNQIFADRLYADLQNKGVRCWLASEDLKIGDRIRIGIDESIRIHDKLLLVLSKDSVASDWVEQEVETALDRERKEKRTILFPIRLDDTVMKIDAGWPALIKNTRNIGDFRKWKNPEAYQKAFDRLLRDLKAEDRAT